MRYQHARPSTPNLKPFEGIVVLVLGIETSCDETGIALVEDVLDSLDRVDPDIDRAWAQEASDRLAATDLRDIITKHRGLTIGAIV